MAKVTHPRAYTAEEYANPLKSIRPIKIAPTELSHLTPSEITTLIKQIESTAENPNDN
ncbi:Uncharacterised protein [BD1-7 clade bacterium]|uniref:Uncharacterized protein n=1 Tax=BD1-7 clade bacterium TaxID=2029982 RepID=A0A5S9PA78_9GAMM|nr:Uncharacterised protein [BD1-7 clade bacterium]CAA0101407.1 Uncharacterised protein [BD1-7 clade bacterium]